MYLQRDDFTTSRNAGIPYNRRDRRELVPKTGRLARHDDRAYHRVYGIQAESVLRNVQQTHLHTVSSRVTTRVCLPRARTCIEITLHNVWPQRIRALNRSRFPSALLSLRARSRSYDEVAPRTRRRESVYKFRDREATRTCGSREAIGTLR